MPQKEGGSGWCLLQVEKERTSVVRYIQGGVGGGSTEENLQQVHREGHLMQYMYPYRKGFHLDYVVSSPQTIWSMV